MIFEKGPWMTNSADFFIPLFSRLKWKESADCKKVNRRKIKTGDQGHLKRENDSNLCCSKEHQGNCHRHLPAGPAVDKWFPLCIFEGQVLVIEENCPCCNFSTTSHRIVWTPSFWHGRFILFKMGHFRPLFLYFRLFFLNAQLVDKILPMLGFKPRISGVGSDRSTYWANTTALRHGIFILVIQPPLPRWRKV